MIVMQETCHVREVCFLRLKYQSRWSRTPVSDKFNWGAFECGIEWYSSVLLGAMHAGIYLVLSMGNFYCERLPCTVAFWLWDFDFSQLKLGSKLNYSNWTRLEVEVSAPSVGEAHIGGLTLRSRPYLGCILEFCYYSPLGARIKEVREGPPLWQEGGQAISYVGGIS